MITVKGQIIDIDGKTEWLLFHRLSRKVNPIDFLSTTDNIIQFPNFMFTISFLILILSDSALWIKFAVPSALYFIGQLMVNLRFGVLVFRLLRIPQLAFTKFNFIIMSGTLITGFFFIRWWTLLAIPVYFAIMFSSIMLLTWKQKKNIREQFQKSPDNFSIVKNNAFLLTYKYYSKEHHLSKDISPTDEETRNQDWLKPYYFMRTHWEQLESYFNRKAKVYWRVYLQIGK